MQMTESSQLGGAGRNEGVPLRDEATRGAPGVCGERRLVIFIRGCPLVFGCKPPPALFTVRGKKEMI